MSKFRYYCAMCWQEFDAICEHNSGSYYGSGMERQRLNGFCKGDIRECVSTVKHRVKRSPEDRIPFPEDDSIKIR